MIPKCKCGRAGHLKGVSKSGVKYYRNWCQGCRDEGRKAKKDHCEMCLVSPENKSLLDVDHIDGNKSNNDPSNLQTLCKPCHRIKTKKNREYKNR